MSKKNWKKSNIEDFDETNNVYFTKRVEDKILEYKYHPINKSQKNKIYEDTIYPVFTEMISIMINRYKFFYTGMDVETLVQVVNVHMYHQLETCNFNPENGSAFSYFSRMAKNKLIQLQEKNQRMYKKYGFDSINDDENYYENILHNNQEDFNIQEFIVKFIKFLELNVKDMFEKDDELKIAYNILNIMKDDKIVIHNRKLLYFMIKEQGDDRNYKINKVLNVFKNHYERLKNEYLETYTFDYKLPEELNSEYYGE